MRVLNHVDRGSAPWRVLTRIRPIASALLLTIFVLAAQVAPLAHLATHRNDHTHGPELPADHDDDHDRDADHDEFDADHDHDHDDATVDHDGGTPAPGHPSSHEHGQDSAAHLLLALLQGPPPPFLPPPAETLALPLDVVRRSRDTAARPHPPVRGPPRLV